MSPAECKSTSAEGPSARQKQPTQFHEEPIEGHSVDLFDVPNTDQGLKVRAFQRKSSDDVGPASPHIAVQLAP